MARVPTPLPRSLVSWATGLFHGNLGTVAYRLLLITLGGFALVIFAASSPGFFAATLVSMALGILWSDNLRRIIADIWHGRFFSLKV